MPNASEPRLIDPIAVARFRGDLDALLPQGGGGDGEELPADRMRFGLAVSGGPDSMAMLLLAHAALPGRIEAATVDHGLRPAAGVEAQMVARFCADIDVPHQVLRVEVGCDGGIQAAARQVRYAALTAWCRERTLSALLTAHHADDQAETLLMRLARGSGIAGLSAIRARRDLDGVVLVRPLLGWRRAELAALADGLACVDDPSNRDPHYDRTRARTLLAQAGWIDPLRVAGSAAHLADAEAALAWVVDEAIRSRCTARDDGGREADLDGLPHALRWRMLAKLVGDVDSAADGATIERALQRLDRGETASIGRAKITPGRYFLIERAPDRR